MERLQQPLILEGWMAILTWKRCSIVHSTIWRFVALIDPDKQIERDKSFCPQHSSPRKNYKNNSDASDQQHCKRVTLLHKSISLSKNSF